MLKRILGGLVLFVAILAAGAGYYLSTNLDSIVQAAIQKYGTEATRATVKLDQVKIGLATGEASLFGLSLGSPEGFTAEKSVYVGNISVAIDTKSVTGSGPIIIKDIRIIKPQIAYEVNASGENNLQTIARNAQKYAASLGSVGKEKTAKPNASDKKESERKIIINNLIVSEGLISISQPLLKGKQLSADLPVIHLTNIGKNNGGATPAEVGEKLIAAIAKSASDVAAASLERELRSTLEEKGQEMLDEAVGKIDNQLKGLFGR